MICGGVGSGAMLTQADLARDEDCCCMGAVMNGPAGCYCWEPVYEVDQVVPVPGPIVVRVDQCHDCAYRSGSPELADEDEREQLLTLARGDNPFWCHQGIRRPIEWHHPDGRVRPGSPPDYRPPIVGSRPYQADGTPAEVCAGWARLRSRQEVSA